MIIYCLMVSFEQNKFYKNKLRKPKDSILTMSWVWHGYTPFSKHKKKTYLH